MSVITKVGIMPFNVAQFYGASLTRRAVFIETPENIKPIGEARILLNINHYPTSPYSKDMVWYKEQLLKVPLAELRPKVISIENEPEHYPEKSIEDYCNELATAVATLPGYRITNGGTTLPLYYWYYQKTKDSGFLGSCVPDSSKQPLINGSLNARIQSVQTELDCLKSLPIVFWNIHFYLTKIGQVAPMVRMIKYVSDYVGKPPISNECGFYTEGLLNDVITIAKETQMKFCILYSGGDLCLQISKEEFNAVSEI